MNNEQIRAQLISILWSLKHAINKHPQGVGVLHHVHFMIMLKDEDYRQTVLREAAKAGVPEIKRLAEEALKINLPGKLVRGSGDTAKTISASHDPEVAETVSGDAVAAMGNPAQSGLNRRQVSYTLLTTVAVLVVFSGVVSAFNMWMAGQRVQYVSGSIMESVVWGPDTEYVLDGLVFVESGATLTIKPGTQVSGKPGSALIVTRDASINAQGSKTAPIVMTSAQPKGKRQRGDWGGVVLLGNAPINTGTGHIEGIDSDDPRGGFGGDAPSGSCGVLKYVRIEFAGYEISQDNELNGLTVGGCGSGTILSHIQVHMGLDDGIEFFGGTANLKYILISRPGDDGLDWDRGWQGKGQFIIVHQGPDDGDNGIEADNFVDDKDAQPRSSPILSNVTLIGSGNPEIAQRGLLLRRGTGGDLRNFLVTGFTSEALDVRDSQTVAISHKGRLNASGWVIADPSERFFSQEIGDDDDDGGFSEQGWIEDASKVNLVTAHQVLNGMVGLATVPDFTPPARSDAAKYHVPIPQDEFWDEGANYAGAVRPGERVSWLDGWTSYPLN